MLDMRRILADEVKSIVPLDEKEQEHIFDVVNWIKSSQPIYRISKPDNPPKHLVSYFVVVDSANRSLLLVDHIKAKLWLPTGGHVENNEDPASTVLREAKEELGIDAKFLSVGVRRPLFVTVTSTRGSDQHTDVSLWYAIEGSIKDVYEYDKTEFVSYGWFSFEDVLSMKSDVLDPHMHRFTSKLASLL